MKPVNTVQDVQLQQPREIVRATEQDGTANGFTTGQTEPARQVSDAEFKRYLQETLKENHRLLAKLAE